MTEMFQVVGKQSMANRNAEYVLSEPKIFKEVPGSNEQSGETSLLKHVQMGKKAIRVSCICSAFSLQGQKGNDKT